VAEAEEVTLPKRTPEEREPSLEAAENRSLIDDVEVLIEDGRTYLEAELNYQKTRGLFVADLAGQVAAFGVAGLVFALMALVALTVGLVIALTPPLGVWGATGVVVIVWLLVAVIAFTVAAGRWRQLMQSFGSPGDGTK
jgi:uncharacterized membrane protein YqjE